MQAKFKHPCTITDFNMERIRLIYIDYSVEIRTPANIDYRGYKLTSTVAPSSGTVVLSALNILSGYNLTYAINEFGINSDQNLTAHRLVESMKVRPFPCSSSHQSHIVCFSVCIWSKNSAWRSEIRAQCHRAGVWILDASSWS